MPDSENICPGILATCSGILDQAQVSEFLTVYSKKPDCGVK